MITDLWAGVRRHARTLLDLTLPAMCPACGERLSVTDQGLCDSCWDHIVDIRGPLCPRCGRAGVDPGRRCPGCLPGEVHYTWARQAAHWAEPLSDAIHALKYHGVAELAEPMARLLARLLVQQLQGEAWDLVAPVPLHRVRERERGYNQSALIARELARKFSCPVDERAVVRHRATRSQTHLSRAERLVNVADAFDCPEPELVAGQRVLLVDDVYTTGSTVNETAGALRAAGTAEVYALTVARSAP